MILYLEKRGCDFQPDGKSDLGNFRLFLEFIDKEGRRVCGDVSRGYVWSKGKVVGDGALYARWQYENYKGAFAYPLPGGCAGQYTKADVLSLVNQYSAVKYDAAEIVEKLPAAARQYPESVSALNRAYLAADHAALFQSLEQKIRRNFADWMRASDYTFHDLTPDEYKRLTLLAFQRMADQYGVVEVRAKDAESRLKPGALIAHHMTKHFFEEQGVIDPYADKSFLRELLKLSPYYVGRYVENAAQ